MHIKTFVFNPFQVNTYILYDESGEGIIIDCACTEERERKKLQAFIAENKIRLKAQLITHAHIDHIAGAFFAKELLHLELQAHPDSVGFLNASKAYGESFGFGAVEPVKPAVLLHDEDRIKFGNSELRVISTPGHADGSICFYAEKDDFVVSGDVLFCESIGRTDLPTGNYETLMQSIKEKLFALPENTIVYPGHGPETSIGHEKKHNPFLG
jgi:hydroxyacylglutathione hydrolase